MGSSILLAALIVEIILTTFCIRTKSNQIKMRSIINIIEFLTLLIMMLLSIIAWNFRYYSMIILWLILAVIGSVTLIRKRENKKTYKGMGIIYKSLGIMVLISIATLPAIIFPEYNMVETTGEYKVASSTYTYTDVYRVETFTDTGDYRKLNVEAWYPKELGKYPLIIFSHGGISNKSSNESLYNELASNGYVVFSVDHTYHSLTTTDNEGHVTIIDNDYMKELNSEDAKSDKQKSFEYYQSWMEIRTSDLSFLIDYILLEADKEEIDPVYKLIDREKIGVMGHSLGGSAALGIGRMRANDVKAVIALESPFMYDIEGVIAGEFIFDDEVYPLPVLNVYTDSSWSHLAEWPQYAQNHKLLSDTEAIAYNIYISGVGHFSLTDMGLSSPILVDMLNGQKSTRDNKYCLEVINKVCLEFFDCYLKVEGEFGSKTTY